MADHASAGADEDVWTPESLTHRLFAATARHSAADTTSGNIATGSILTSQPTALHLG
jgi:hypothetical protein